MLYRLLFKLVLQRIDAERAHDLSLRLLRAASRLIPAAPSDARLAIEVFGRTHRSPLGVAAGLDKNARVFRALTRLGFGHVEVGTVTADAQPGNPRPRVFRLTRQRALINRMGFPNEGATAVEQRIRRDRLGTEILGINVGKSRSADLDEAEADYAVSVTALAPHADFLVVNVSSPNTPGLRDLQAIEPLRSLLSSVQTAIGRLECPLLVKISPDLTDAEIDEIADLSVDLGIAGIVCTNTTTSRDGLPAVEGGYEQGGLSGEPLRQRSLEVLRRIRRRVGDELVLISVGGVSGGADVWDRLLAGASLVQAYTGFVYGGPMWPRRVNRDLCRRLDAAGAGSIADVIGSQSDA